MSDVSEPVVIVQGVEARSVADCPYKVSSPEGVEWCREFTQAQAFSPEFRSEAFDRAHERMEAAGIAVPEFPIISSVAAKFSGARAWQWMGLAATGIAGRAGFDAVTSVVDEMADALDRLNNLTPVTREELQRLADAFADSPDADGADVILIRGKPAGRRSRTERRRCPKHGAWADSCRRCGR